MCLVALRSFELAIFGRVFEGLATDNLLHFSFSNIYVRVTDESYFSRTLSTSMGLYMLGLATGPLISGLFLDFTTSFTIALGIFGSCMLYLVMFVPLNRLDSRKSEEETDPSCSHSTPASGNNTKIKSG